MACSKGVSSLTSAPEYRCTLDSLKSSPPGSVRQHTTALVAVAVGLALLALCGCQRPIGATQVSFRQAYKQIDRSVLTSSKPSATSERVLHRFDLDPQFARNPAAALTNLHARALTDDRRDLLFALAELNYLQGDWLRRSVKPRERREAPDFFLAATIYAYLYLLGDASEPPPGPLDRSFRDACDLYNCALALGLSHSGDTNRTVSFATGRRPLPTGTINVQFSAKAFPWKLDDFKEFLPANAFNIRGISVRNRDSGLGAPLIGVLKTNTEFQFPRATAATLIGRLQGDLKAFDAGRAELMLELYSPYTTNSVPVAGRNLPLEADSTAPIAYALNDQRVWKLGLAQFLKPIERVRSGIYSGQPHQFGKVPVVLVHGTMSSPIWWVEMMNTLYGDRTLREHCEFWYFIYNSGNPISYSASKLRAALQEQVNRLDPEGKDPALRQMVIIGHSQGGLLAKLTATATGDALWRTISDKPFDAVQLPPEQKGLLRQNYFYEPLPFVTSVVFIATPHRGSYLATSLIRKVAYRFMSFPDELVRASKALLSAQKDLRLPAGYRGSVPSSLDSMSPRNPWLLALASCPVAPGVSAHSIIAIRGNGAPPQGGDGVVKYESAHVDYAKSERIVRSGHTCRDKSATIEEVRRILLEHLAALDPPLTR